MKIKKSKMRKLQTMPRVRTVKVDLDKMYRTGMIEPPKVTATVRVDIEKMYELGIIERPIIPEAQPKWKQAWLVFTENVGEFLRKLDRVIYPYRKQVAMGASAVCGMCLIILCISSFPSTNMAAEGTDAKIAINNMQYENDIVVTYVDSLDIVSEPVAGEMRTLVRDIEVPDGEAMAPGAVEDSADDVASFEDLVESIIIEETDIQNHTAYEAYEEEETVLEEEEESDFDHAILVMAADTDESIEVFVENDDGSETAGLLYNDSMATILEQEDGWTKIESGELVGWVADENLLFDDDAKEKADEMSVTVATVEVASLNVRKQPDTESAIMGVANEGDELVIVDEGEDGWAEVEFGDATAYINTDYAGVELRLSTGETMEVIEAREEEERRAEEAARKAAEEAEAQRKAEEDAARAAEEAIELTALMETEAGEPAGTTGMALSGIPVVSCTQEEVNMLAAIIYCEAGNQSYEGKVAVGSVVLNRLNSAKFPNTIETVIRSPRQFSPVRSGKFDRVYSSGGWSESCYQAALDALAGVQPVGNALYFKNPKLAGAHSGLTIGDHVFW